MKHNELKLHDIRTYNRYIDQGLIKEEDYKIKIRAIIYVIRESQKGIIIGHEGKALAKVGKEARADMEKFMDKKVLLDLFVKVKKDWRDSDTDLKRFGYIS